MTQPLGILQHKIRIVKELQNVVETMKTMASINLGMYEKVNHALAEYEQIIEEGLCAVFQEYQVAGLLGSIQQAMPGLGVVVFGSDQGMVGRFNEQLADLAVKRLALVTGEIYIWCVGERMALKLQDSLPLKKLERVPDSSQGITTLVGNLLLDIVAMQERGKIGKLLVFYNKTTDATGYESVEQQLLPLDEEWLLRIGKKRWPTQMVPQVINGGEVAFPHFIREHLFFTMCWACAQSIVSENSSRLAVMQRAAKNIDEILAELTTSYNGERQNLIDEELFDVIFGYDALATPHNKVKSARKKS